jgi:hypothetical protein
MFQRALLLHAQQDALTQYKDSEETWSKSSVTFKKKINRPFSVIMSYTYNL